MIIDDEEVEVALRPENFACLMRLIDNDDPDTYQIFEKYMDDDDSCEFLITALEQISEEFLQYQIIQKALTEEEQKVFKELRSQRVPELMTVFETFKDDLDIHKFKSNVMAVVDEK